jgi:hypothetical protein
MINLPQIIADVRRAIDESPAWKRLRGPDADPDAEAWEVESGAWKILVVAWPAERDVRDAMRGTVITRWGFSGVATRTDGTILWLPPDVAERAARRAKGKPP